MKNHEVLADLKGQGYEVTIGHKRNHYTGHNKMDGRNGLINPKGGATIIKVKTPNDDVFVGEALCSEHDVFNKRRGVTIALGRALSKEEDAGLVTTTTTTRKLKDGERG